MSNKNDAVSSYNIDHAIIETDRGSPESEGKINEPLPFFVAEEFHWHYKGRKFTTFIGMTGSHPNAFALADKWESLDADARGAELLELKKIDGASDCFGAALEMYNTERAKSDTWEVRANSDVCAEIVQVIDAAVKQSREKVKLGTLTENQTKRFNEFKDSLKPLVELLTENSTYDARSHVQMLVKSTLQVLTNCARAITSSNSWAARANKRNDVDGSERAMNKLSESSARYQDNLLLLNALLATYDEVLDEEDMYGLNYKASSGVYAAMNAAAFGIQMKYSHPGALTANVSAVDAGNDMLANSALAGL